VVRRLVICLLAFSIMISITACSSTKITKETNSSYVSISGGKSYQIPLKDKKVNYSDEDFKNLYSQYLKSNNITLETSPESDKTGMSKEQQLKYYTVHDITPEEVKKELHCQIFKVNYTCDTFVIYKGKLFPIALGFGGFGVVSLSTCDFDEDGKKDLIYTFSWGSGLHRSHIGIFNLAKEKEEWLDFVQENDDIMVEKISDKSFKIYIANISSQTDSYFTHFTLSKKDNIGNIQKIEGKVKATKTTMK